MRQLKHHEQKLLKKVDFLQWKSDATLQESKVIRTYHLQERDDYSKYNRLCGEVKKMAHRLSLLEPSDPFRVDMTEKLLHKLAHLGVIDRKVTLSQCEKVTVSAFCRRRLAVLLVRMKMAEHLKEATTLIEQGHIRVGPDVVKDPAYLVTRPMEDFVTWVDTSKIKRKIATYNDQLDDFELL